MHKFLIDMFQSNRLDVLCCISVKDNSNVDERDGIVHVIFERAYTPFVMKTPVRIVVLTIFVALLATHIIVLPQIEVGLDQKLSMPEDSYVLKYFTVNNIERNQEKNENRLIIIVTI